MRISQTGIDLIKRFEGLRVVAYPDAGTGGAPWTIGYGSTSGVTKGMTITEEEAEQRLRRDLSWFESRVDQLISVPLTQPEFDALVSFTYNVGDNSLLTSTLRRRLVEGQDDRRDIYEEEMMKWVNGSSGPLPGLVKRRKAEIELACKGVDEVDPDVHTSSDCFLLDAVRYFAELPHQERAIRDLWDGLDKAEQLWFIEAYRNENPPTDKPSGTFPMKVPYFYQRDSRAGQGERMCFSSSMAMALDYIDPDVIEGDDDWYLQIVQFYGDTVSASAQEQAARSLGFTAQFRTDGTLDLLEEILDSDTPVPIGILHHGTIDYPTGGGHWICLVGYDDVYFDVHDPFGEMDLVNGGYVATGPKDGKFQRYTKQNLLKRWNIANDQDGWLVDLRQF